MTWRPMLNLVNQTKSRFTTVSGSLAETLADRIISGQYPPGTQLRQDALAAELGASRIPVREALLQLEALGLVTKLPHRGAAVSTLSPGQIDQIFELRTLLECELLRRAVPEMTDDDVAAANEANERIAVFKPTAGNVRDWAQLNLSFHLALYRPAGRSVWLEMYQQLHSHTYRFRRAQLQSGPSELVAIAREHREVLRACRRRDVNGAVDALRGHIVGARMSVVQYLARAEAQAVRPRETPGIAPKARRRRTLVARKA
jgi:DNA-binding GntR family transcriptional regulator